MSYTNKVICLCIVSYVNKVICLCSLLTGELDAHLAPIGKEYLRSSKQDAEWESESRGRQCKGIPGSSKRKQSYPKMVGNNSITLISFYSMFTSRLGGDDPLLFVL